MQPRSGLPPRGPGWFHELKFDGYRVQVHAAGGRVRIFSRGGHDYTERYGDLAARLRGFPEAVLDGEAVIPRSDGYCDFWALHKGVARRRPTGVVFMAFDLLRVGMDDIRGLVLAERKARLAELLTPLAGARLRLVEHIEGEDGATVLKHASALRVEGIVSKRASSRYQSGPSSAWIKSKTAQWLAENANRGDVFDRS
jgi:bifunctional non-homologous end joining protein LigD